MKFHSPICALALTLGLSSGHAALLFADSPIDANSTYGSFESITGAGAFAINGTSNTFLLEGLDPGLAWSNFVLTVYDVTTEENPQPDAVTGAPAFASINGVGATSVSFSPTGTLPPGLTGLNAAFNVYTFSFANLVLGGNASYSLFLSGFNSSLGPLNLFTGQDPGGAVLTATAVPEPSAVVLLLAGLAAIGWVVRRRQPR